MPAKQLHPVIAKLQGDVDPASAVREMMQGASIVAQSVGVKVTYTVEPSDGSQHAELWHAGMRHLHAAIAMIGVRAKSILGPTIKRLNALPTTR